MYSSNLGEYPFRVEVQMYCYRYWVPALPWWILSRLPHRGKSVGLLAGIVVNKLTRYCCSILLGYTRGVYCGIMPFSKLFLRWKVVRHIFRVAVGVSWLVGWEADPTGPFPSIRYLISLCNLGAQGSPQSDLTTLLFWNLHFPIPSSSGDSCMVLKLEDTKILN